MRNQPAIQVKVNAHYTCQECGSTELIHAHHEIPGDDTTLIALCAECHSRRHPNLPKGLFLSRKTKNYWHNKSAASLARELGVHPGRIKRTAKRLEIPPGELSPLDEELIENNIYDIDGMANLAYRLKIPWRTVWHWKRKNRPSKATVEKIELVYLLSLA